MKVNAPGLSSDNSEGCGVVEAYAGEEEGQCMEDEQMRLQECVLMPDDYSQLQPGCVTSFTPHSDPLC